MTNAMRDWLVRATARQPRPLDVLFELTEVCNLRCRHCYLPQHTDKGLSTEEIKSILDQLAEAGTLFLTFTGGEVLTRPDFIELATYARRKDLGLRIFTNGTLLTSKLADQIRDLHPLGIEISLYGATAPVHEAVTGVAGSFERTIQGARLLRERGVPVSLKTPLMRHNIHQVAQMQALAQEMGARYFWDPYITARRDGSREPWAERATDEQFRQLFADQALSLDRTALNEWVTQSSLTEAEAWQSQEGRICGAGVGGCRIAVDGKVYPCAEINLCAGDLRRQSLDEIWQSSPVLQQIRQMRMAELTQCLPCEHFSRCARRCPGLALLESGDLFAPLQEACRLTELRYQAWEAVNDNENKEPIQKR